MNMPELFARRFRWRAPQWNDGPFWMCDWLAGEVLVFDVDMIPEVAARVDRLRFLIDWSPIADSLPPRMRQEGPR
jgi:hypothetical protein